MAGGAQDFINFMKDELMPKIDQKYPVDKNNRGIVGFSFGGFFASYMLLKNPQLFDNYLIISPGLVWDNNYILELEEEYGTKRNDLMKKIFFSLSSEESRELIIRPTLLF